MPIKAVLFDMFDTLMLIEKDHMFYSPSLKRAHRSLVESGVDVSFAEFRKAYIRARDAIYAAADPTLEEPHFNVRIADALRSLGYKFEADSPVVSRATLAFCEEFMTYVRIDDDTETVLRKLHGRYRLGVVSNFAIPECVHKLLEQHRLAGLFDVVVVSAAVNRRKPSPEIYRRALERLGVTAEETVFVGDTVDADVEGPKSVSMKTVFIERRVQEGLEQACPDQTIKRLSELPAALERCL
jgi:HAD superfamily hydrolase (TIGR01549 family)